MSDHSNENALDDKGKDSGKRSDDTAATAVPAASSSSSATVASAASGSSNSQKPASATDDHGVDVSATDDHGIHASGADDHGTDVSGMDDHGTDVSGMDDHGTDVSGMDDHGNSSTATATGSSSDDGASHGSKSNRNHISGSSGDDKIAGGSGIDDLTLSGSRSSHTLTKTATGWTVSSSSGGTDTLENVERIKFSDTMVALDIEGHGGQAYRVYQAAFNRTPDSVGLGFWINSMDDGANIKSVAEGFVGSAEFKAIYGTNPTNAQIVTKLYDNVLHRSGDSSGINFWLGVLDSKGETLAGVLAAFSESAENQAGLIGVIGNGFAYTPFA